MNNTPIFQAALLAFIQSERNLVLPSCHIGDRPTLKQLEIIKKA